MAAKLIGSKVPSFRHVPRYRYSKGEDAAALAHLGNLPLFEWQIGVLKDWLSYKAAGPWNVREGLLLCPRQNGKTRIITAYAIYLCVVEQVPMVLYSAHEFRTSQEIFRREVRPTVQKLWDIGALDSKPVFRDNTTETSVTVGKAKILFSSRSSGTGRGFSGDVILIDECYALTPEQMSALRYTIAARPDAVIRYASSAGMVTSEMLEQLRAKGYQKKMTLHEWRADETDDFGDEKTWARANPSYGLMISKETVQSEYEAPMSETSFSRERLGIFETFKESTEPPVFNSATIATSWADTEIVGSIAFGVAAEPDRSRAFIAACGTDADGNPHLELVDTQKRVSWLPERLEELDRTHNPLAIVIDAVGGMNSVAGTLEESDLPIKSLTMAEAIKSVSSFEDALTEGRLTMTFDDSLAAALAHAKKRSMRTGDLWDTPNAEALQSPLQAVTLAYWGWLNRNIDVKNKKKKRTGRWLSA